MVCIAARFFLLSLAAAATNGNEFEEDPRLISSISALATEKPVITTTDFYIYNEINQTDFSIEETYSIQNSTIYSLENETPIRNMFKLNLRLLFKELKICRESYSYLTNTLFKRKMYCFLLHEFSEIPNKNLKLGFHCNISKGVVEEMKDKQHFLKIFQRVFALNSKSDSCQPFEIDALGVENLKLNSEDEWKPKVSHMSHIYLGTSMYPIFTEESWVIERSRTSKSSAPTKSSFTKETELRPKNGLKIYQLLTPLRWENNNKSKSRFSRSIPAAGPKPSKSKDKLSDVYKSKSTMEPKIHPPREPFDYSKDGMDNLTLLKTGLTFEKNRSPEPFHKAFNFLYKSLLNIIRDMLNMAPFYKKKSV